MTATNHTITGILVAAAYPHPLVAIPLALASHLVLDSLPHYGDDKLPHRSSKFKLIVASDAIVALIVLLTVLFAIPTHWFLLLICGVVAASPDLLWLPYWIDELRRKKAKKKYPLIRFLSWIQWGERAYGWIFEFIWFIGATYLLVPVLSR